MTDIKSFISKLLGVEKGLQRILDHNYSEDLARLDVAEEFLDRRAAYFILTVDGAYASTCSWNVGVIYYKYGYVLAGGEVTDRDRVIYERAIKLRERFDAFWAQQY